MEKYRAMDQKNMRRSYSAYSVFILMLSVMLILITVSCLGAEASYAALSGEGSEEAPYEIESYGDLKEFASIVNGTHAEIRKNTGACAVLMNDIDCSEDKKWVPIGNDENRYIGHFYGADNKIKKLTHLSNKDIALEKDLQGLFGFIGEEGNVEYLGLDEGEIVGCSNVGSITGYNTGTISNCYNTGDVVANRGFGGLAGGNGSGKISDCYNTGDVIENEVNIGKVFGGDADAGGIAGTNAVYAEITNCYNTGDVSTEFAVGGITGINTEYSTITNCYNTGDISGNTDVVGDIGGVSGSNYYSWITNCYNTGNVSGIADYVGGITGRTYRDHQSGYIANCYNTGAVNGVGETVGGVTGESAVYNEETPEYSAPTPTVISNCYYDTTFGLITKAVGETSGKQNIVNVEGLKMSQMTGASAISEGNMTFSYAEGETSPWITRTNKGNYWYYPHLKGFKYDSSGKVADWSPKLIVDTKWIELNPPSFTFDGYAQHLLVEQITVSKYAVEIPEGAIDIKYYRKTEDNEYKIAEIFTSLPMDTYKLTYNIDGRSVTRYFKVLDYEEDFTFTFQKQTENEAGDTEWISVDYQDVVNAGTYKTVINFNDGPAQEKKFQIKPIPLTIKASDQVIKEGEDPVSEPDQAELSGILDIHSLDAITMTAQGEQVVASNARIIDERGRNVTEGYDITYEPGKLTVIPKISATVTFRVVNGSWNDGTSEDKKVTINGHVGDTLKLTQSDVPAVGENPAKGYKKEGSWDAEPVTGAELAGTEVYTYTYEEDKSPDNAEVDDTIPTVNTGKISTIGNITKKTMKIIFPTSSNADNYRIQYRLAGKASWKSAWSTGNGTYVVKNLKKHSLCEFRIAGYRKLSNGRWVRGKWSNISRRYMSAVSQKPLKAGKRKLTVTWKKDKKASGYQIKYSLKKNMSGAKTVTVSGRSKTSRTIKKLKKGKTYYVQVRPYKIKSGKKYLGILSGKKKAKVK